VTCSGMSAETLVLDNILAYGTVDLLGDWGFLQRGQPCL
jgi:hypothetical protein